MGLVFDILKERKKERFTEAEQKEAKNEYVDIKKLEPKKQKPAVKKPAKEPNKIKLVSNNKRRPGFFIVIEGIDGSGGETQSKRLKKYFEDQKKRVALLRYPEYETDIGQLIHKYLHKGTNMPINMQFLIYAADIVKDVEKIEGWLKSGNIVIADRYFTSTIAYQAYDHLSQMNIKRFAGMFGIPKPDVVFLLKVKPETAIRRKISEKLNLDKNESNEKLLTSIAATYDKMAKSNVFGKWVVVDGEKGKDEVFADILKKLRSLK